MKKINRALAIVLAVIMVLAVPFSVNCATKTLALNAKGYKKVTNVKKTGTYQLKCRFKDGFTFNPEFVSFQAPSTGTYAFTLKNLRGAGDPSSKESFCTCSVETGSQLAFTGWLEQYNDWGWDAKGPVFKENKDSVIGLSSIWYASLDPRDHSRVTVKYKLKKGEKIYFCISQFRINDMDHSLEDDMTAIMDFVITKK